MDNECMPYYEPGDRITGHCDSAVTGKRFVDIAADVQSGPGLSATGDGGNVVIEHATAAGIALGVSSHDAAVGNKVTVILDHVVPVTATGAINAGAEVEVGANGTAAALSAGRAVGRSLNTVADGEDAMILQYRN